MFPYQIKYQNNIYTLANQADGCANYIVCNTNTVVGATRLAISADAISKYKVISKYNSEVAQQINNIIFAQLGGNRFIAMTGSKVSSTLNGLYINLKPNLSKTNVLEIDLSDNDTYTMKFHRFSPAHMHNRTFEYIPEKSSNIQLVEGVYADMLQKVFTETTGFDTHL